jgi:UDP-N-acetylmuramate dehydrogenase
MDNSILNVINSKHVAFMAPASEHCTFRLGGALEYFVCPTSLDELIAVCQNLTNGGYKYKIVGNMSNILPSDGVNSGIFISTKNIVDEPQIFGTRITVSAGYLLSKLCAIARDAGLSGLEGLIGIPATVGGAVANNASAFGYSVSDRLESLLVYSHGKISSISASEAGLSYHHSKFTQTGEIVISATFNLVAEKQEKIAESIKDYALIRACRQPNAPSAGSVFKKCGNMSAGFYIEEVGLKGEIYKGAQISDKHANFIVNLGTATADSVKYLVNLCQNKVKEKFNVNLEREIEYLGENYGSTCRLSHTQSLF